VATVTKEYLGNAFLEIEAALKKGKTQFVLSAGQMEQLLRVHAEVTEAKNEVVRENWRFNQALKRISEWDCLNPPQRDLCADLPWLRELVDDALRPVPS
jgi:hypothetical protein